MSSGKASREPVRICRFPLWVSTPVGLLMPEPVKVGVLGSDFRVAMPLPFAIADVDNALERNYDQTMWYLHSHLTGARLCQSFTTTSFLTYPFGALGLVV
jgi:hypothetical protein